ncbi:hypothetical protein ACK8HX_08430 [Oryzobacter sp. R7]|uniref:hypothetical protein n=1 Tax=Oryzobacter faecalis TaxID=3388656 RepID=UPI00398C9F8D
MSAARRAPRGADEGAGARTEGTASRPLLVDHGGTRLVAHDTGAGHWLPELHAGEVAEAVRTQVSAAPVAARGGAVP